MRIRVGGIMIRRGDTGHNDKKRGGIKVRGGDTGKRSGIVIRGGGV